MRRGFMLACLVFGTFLMTKAQDREEIKVLFVGNSLTFFYNLPQVVASIAETQGHRIITRQSTVGGSSLEEHWKREKGTRTRDLLESQQWDYVVFNNHSRSALDDPEAFVEYGKKFIDLVREKGAQPILMMTWAYRSNPLMLDVVSSAYKDLASETNTDYVPAAYLFERARSARPDLDLFLDDKHPSSNGTYMLGLAFYKFFTGEKTSAVPERLTTFDKDGELTYLIFMNRQDADFLKHLVDNYNFKTLAD
ncbi:MAG: DUF4886 domain-containing protein [Bacteroidota bacterium]